MTAVATKPGFSLDPIEDKKQLLKRTICKGATDEEFELFYHACKRTGLDPFMKQVYAVKRWDSKERKEVMTIQTSIDGFRLIAERTGRYSPGRESTFTYNDKEDLISATAYVKKMTADGTWHEIAATAFFEEYCQRTKEGKLTNFWEKMPHVMLAKCAESLALRRAFPAELSGLYTQEEMGQVEKEKTTVTTEVLEAPLSQQQIEILEAFLEDEAGIEQIKSTYKIDSIFDIPGEKFNKVIGYLKKRNTKQQGEQQWTSALENG